MAMWLMLQQDKAEDFVIASGQQISVRNFVQRAASHLDIELAFEGDGVRESARVLRTGKRSPAIKPGDVIVRVDERYFRPTRSTRFSVIRPGRGSGSAGNPRSASIG